MRTRGSSLVDWSARTFGDDMAVRVFAPLVADWQQEFAHAPHAAARLTSALRGLLAFGVAAFSVGVSLSTTGPADWSTLRRGAVLLAGFACLGGGLLLVPFAPWLGAKGTLFLRTVPFLLPSIAALSLPFALVPAAMALAAGTRPSTRWRHRATVGLAAVSATVCLSALLAWIVPTSNQAWREAVSGRRLTAASAVGTREMSVLELRAAALGGLTAQRDQWSDADATRELLRRTAIATTWPLALAYLGWRLGRHRPVVSMPGMVFWWALPMVVFVGLQPALHAPASLDIRTFIQTPEFAAAATWCAMALALRPRVMAEASPS